MVYFFELLGRRTAVKVLTFFLENPSKEIHAAAAQKELEMSKKSLLDALSDLKKAGVLNERQAGRAVFYSLNRSSVLVRELKKILTLSRLSAVAEKAVKKGFQLFVFGSAARGEDTERSDVDLLVVGEDRSEAEGVLRDLGAKYKRLFFTPLEYSQLARKDKALYESIERDKIKIG